MKNICIRCGQMKDTLKTHDGKFICKECLGKDEDYAECSCRRVVFKSMIDGDYCEICDKPI